MDKTEATFLVDSGSGATLINLSLIQDLQLEHTLKPTSLELFAITGERIATAGEITVDLTVAETCVPHKCVVVSVNMECDVLLGLDFLKWNSMMVHFLTLVLGT